MGADAPASAVGMPSTSMPLHARPPTHLTCAQGARVAALSATTLLSSRRSLPPFESPTLGSQFPPPHASCWLNLGASSCDSMLGFIVIVRIEVDVEAEGQASFPEPG